MCPRASRVKRKRSRGPSLRAREHGGQKDSRTRVAAPSPRARQSNYNNYYNRCYYCCYRGGGFFFWGGDPPPPRLGNPSLRAVLISSVSEYRIN